MVISEVGIGFLTNFLYDFAKKNVKLPDSLLEVYSESIEELSRKYPKLEKIYIDDFLSQERVKKEIINYFESANYDESFNIFKYEFFELLDKNYFSEKDAEEILRDFFKILDYVIGNKPELSGKFQIQILKRIDRSTSNVSKNFDDLIKSQVNIQNNIKEIKEEYKTEFSGKITPELTINYEYIESIPKNKNFVGRSIELKELKDLKSQIIVIEGISGIGKTSISAELALKTNLQNNVFWCDLNEIVTAKTILYQLASFLNQRHYPESYKILNKINDLNFLTDVIINDLEKGDYFLFFDDYHSIKDEQIKVIFEKFKKKFTRAKVIVITRPDPKLKFYNVYDISTGKCYLEVLKGLRYEDTKEKLLSLNCKFDEDVLSKIYEKTTGHPIALELLAIAVKNKSNLDAIIKSSPDIPEDLIKYLFDEIFLKISSGEQNFLKAISVYRQPIDINAVHMISKDDTIGEIAIKLIDKQLIEKNGDLYSIHPLIKNLSYSLIGDKESFHRKAAEYLNQKNVINSNELLELQYHLFSAKDYLNSAWITIQTSESLIRQGNVSSLLEILLLYKKEMLPFKEWIFIGTIIGNLYIIKMDLRKAEQYFTEMLDLSNKLDYENGISSLLNDLSGIAFERGEIDKALRYQLKSLESYEKQTDIKGKATVLVNVGRTYLEKREPKKSLHYSKKALVEFKKINDWAGKGRSLNLLGLVYRQMGDWDKAIEKFLEARENAIKIGDYGEIASISANLGGIYADRGELDKAEKECSIELEFSKKTENISKIQGAYENYGNLLTDKREIEKALEYHKKSLEIALKYGMLKDAARTYGNITNDYLYKGDFNNAFENCKKCIIYAKKDSEIIAGSLISLAGIQQEKGKKETAKRLYEKGIELYEKIGDDYSKAGAYHQLGLFYFKNNDRIKAVEYLNKSLILFDTFNATKNCLMACTNCIIVYMELNKLDKAVEFQEKKLGYLLRCNDVENISLIYRNLISNYFELKNWNKVDQLCKKKINLDSDRDDKKELVIVYSILAVTLRELKKYNSSIKYHKLCINLAIEIEDNNALATAYNDLGNTFSITEKVKEAEESFLESIKIKNNIGNEVGVMTSYSNLGSLYTRTGRLQQGIELLEKAEEYFATHNRMNDAIRISLHLLDAIFKDIRIMNISSTFEKRFVNRHKNREIYKLDL